MKRLAIAFIIIALILLSAAVLWKVGTSPVNARDDTPGIFVIERGQGVKAIAKNLKEQGFIKNQIVFFLLTKKLGLDKNIEAGDYRLYPSMNAYEIAEELTHGTLDIWVTIPEGKRSEEVAEIFKTKVPSYEAPWTDELSQHEGYLFPDTYLIPKDADIDFVVKMLTGNFDNKYNSVPNREKLPKEDLVIIASLIEREAKHDVDRPLVSSVIHNRLDLGMKLDIDATLQYALGYQGDGQGWWKRGITSTDKLINSPYNTYRVAGLPPTPISNPGLAALQAAASPKSTDFFYYITDKNGVNRYAETIDGHNENIEKYGL